MNICLYFIITAA